MKLRFKDNSIRFRLSAEEVDTLLNEGSIFMETSFGVAAPSFRCGIVVKEVMEPEADLTDNVLIATIPPAIADKWADSPLVGIDHRMGIGGGKFLRILIEKDFGLLPKDDDDGPETAYAD
ncbi:MAG: hypothetical protein RL226_1848 [Bacteroidota bacterium]